MKPRGRFLRDINANYFEKLRLLVTECPISTADGVRAADVAWISPARLREIGGKNCLRASPEICVEVLSPGNTHREMSEKMALYFAAGAGEVWLCSETGAMQFFHAPDAEPASESCLFPEFPGLFRNCDSR